jgi:hypothetical protein
VAPDGASLKAGQALAVPEPWAEAGYEGQAVWGDCRGSAKLPYQVVCDLSGPAYKCTCPSRKFPCKHALGLLLLWSQGSSVVGPGTPPPDAAAWLATTDAAALAAVGVTAFACTPDLFPDLMAAAIDRRDLDRWAADQGITTAAPVGTHANPD